MLVPLLLVAWKRQKKNNEQKLADLLPVSFRAQLTIFEDIHGRQESEEGRYRQIDEAND